jgi:hypothetical protein
MILNVGVGFLSRTGSRINARRSFGAASGALHTDVKRPPDGCNQHRRERDEKHQQ